MEIEIKIPSVGESVQEALLAQWYKKTGEPVQKDEPLFVIETDKVTLEVVAETDGILTITVAEGEMAPIGAVVGKIKTSGEKPSMTAGAPAPAPAETQPAPPVEADTLSAPPSLSSHQGMAAIVPPSVRRLAAESHLDLSQVAGTGPGGRITKGDVLLHLENRMMHTAEKPAPTFPQGTSPPAAVEPPEPRERVTVKPITPIRKRISAHLVEAVQNTAMLTTFNEIDMSRVMDLRRQLKERFRDKYGVSLGIMSFFIKACVEALKEIPSLNAVFEESNIVYRHYYHIGVAIGSDKGLVVPVIRHADQLSFAQIEQAIVDYVVKIKENRLELSEMRGGTFTVSNGGVFGSLLSTPILNMPQSGILGMHKMEKRPVVVDDQIVIRPMMYVAVTYDHRMVDGRESVTFLKHIKTCVENPERIMLEI